MSRKDSLERCTVVFVISFLFSLFILLGIGLWEGDIFGYLYLVIHLSEKNVSSVFSEWQISFGQSLYGLTTIFGFLIFRGIIAIDSISRILERNLDPEEEAYAIELRCRSYYKWVAGALISTIICVVAAVVTYPK